MADAISESKDKVDRWLALIDGEQFLQAWQEMVEYARGNLSQMEFAQKMRDARQPLGLPIQRSLKKSAELLDLEGAPPGRYVLFEFDSHFAGQTIIAERVTTMKDLDGAYRVAGYYLV